MIHITHDIDWLSPAHPYSIVKALTHGDKWIKFRQISDRDIFIREIERLLAFDETNGVKAIWLVGAPSSGTFSRFGLRYHIRHKNYHTCLSLLKKAGVETGLHSINTESFSGQIQNLSAQMQKPVKYHRSHYLKFSITELTEQLRTHKVLADYSLGHARQVGIPELASRQDHTPRFIPTVLFDNIFFFEKPETVFNQFLQAIQEAKKRQLDISILFHPENFVIRPELYRYYSEIIHICKNEDQLFDPTLHS